MRVGSAQVLNGAIAAALFNLIYDYLLSQRVKWYAMCPWLDLLNHRGKVEVRSRRCESCRKPLSYLWGAVLEMRNITVNHYVTSR